MNPFMQKFLIYPIAVLSALILVTLLYAVLGKRYTDKIVVTNIIGSLCINIIVLLAYFMDADYILDVAIVFAILSFLSVIVLCRIVQNHVNGRKSEMELGSDEEHPENGGGV